MFLLNTKDPVTPLAMFIVWTAELVARRGQHSSSPAGGPFKGQKEQRHSSALGKFKTVFARSKRAYETAVHDSKHSLVFLYMRGSWIWHFEVTSRIRQAYGQYTGCLPLNRFITNSIEHGPP